MANIQELISSLQSIKGSSDELSTMAASAGGALNTQANAIVALTRPSASGQQAAMAVGAAARSLQQAAAAMKALGRTCDNYMNSARK
jgi:hypothetical protein